MATKATLPSTAVGRRRLLKLADLLEADAKNKKGVKFDLEVIAQRSVPNTDVYGFEDSDFLPDDTVPIDCGTTACAFGLAALSGVFRRQGLSYTIDGSGFTPIHGKSRDMHAARTFFLLSHDE